MREAFRFVLKRVYKSERLSRRGIRGYQHEDAMADLKSILIRDGGMDPRRAHDNAYEILANMINEKYVAVAAYHEYVFTLDGFVAWLEEIYETERR